MMINTEDFKLSYQIKQINKIRNPHNLTLILNKGLLDTQIS